MAVAAAGAGVAVVVAREGVDVVVASSSVMVAGCRSSATGTVGVGVTAGRREAGGIRNKWCFCICGTWVH